MKHIYCISGLGADERVFHKMKFPGHIIHFIKWVTPDKKESISSYAEKLSSQIHHKNPVLIGLSFGGMMCIEIAKLVNPELIILISSVKNKNEIPMWMSLSGRLKLNRIFPMRSFKLIEPLEDYNLGVETPEEKEMVHTYRKNIDQAYSDWAIDNILNWKNVTEYENLYHIHGDKDRIFSVKKVRADYIVPGGGHLMILNKSAEVNSCINTILEKHNSSLIKQLP